MSEIAWLTKKGVGANFKVGDKINGYGIFLNYNPESQRRLTPSPGTIKAVEKDFQENIDTGCPFYHVKVKFDDKPHTIVTHTQPLKLTNSKTE